MSIPSLTFPVDLSRTFLRCYVNVALSGVAWLIVGAITASHPLADILYAAMAVYTAASWHALACVVLMRRRSMAVRVSHGDLALPSIWSLRGERVISNERVVGIERTRHGVRIGVQSGLYASVRFEWFDSEASAERFLEVLRMRVRNVSARERFSVDAMTLVIAVGLVALHIARVAFGGDDEAISLLRWGGLNSTLMMSGEWYRVFTMAFVHANEFVLFSNVALICLLLPGLRQHFGSAASMLVLLISVLVGAAVALPSLDDIAVGSAAAAYGLVGAHLWLSLVERVGVPALLRSIPASLLTFIVSFDVLAQAVSAGVHLVCALGGLGAGAVMTALLRRLGPAWDGDSRREWVRNGVLYAAWLGIFAFVIAAGELLIHDPLRSARALVEVSDASNVELNLGGWWLATSHAASSDALSVARDRLRARLTGFSGGDLGMQDTLATLNYRLDDLSAAVETEAQVLNHEPRERVYATQLARFELRHVERGASAPLGVVVTARMVCVQRYLSALRTASGGSDVDVLILEADKLVGLLRLRNAIAGSCTDLPTEYRAEQTLVVGRVANANSPQQTFVSEWYAADPTILSLP